MNKRKMMAAFLGATMLVSVGASALAAEGNALDSVQNTGVNDETRIAEREFATGTITEISKNDKGEIEFILIKVPARENTDIRLRVSSQTMVVDNETGISAGLQELKVGDRIAASHSPVMTMSLPPQTNTEAIVYNIADNAPSAMLHTVDKVEKTENGIRILVDGGSLYINANQDAKISPLNTKNIVTLEDVKIGDRIFAWYSIVQTSYPGQTATEKLVLIPGAVAPENKSDGFEVVFGGVENAQDLKAVKAVENNGVVMVPLREVAETLGYTVGWNEAEQTATVYRAKGELTMTAKAGIDNAYVDEDYRMWVSAEAFEALNLKVTIGLENKTVEMVVQNA